MELMGRYQDIIFLVFSISNKNSLIEAEKFLETETLKDHGKYNQVPVIAVGNKNDLEYARQVTCNEAQTFLGEGVLFVLETSAAESQDSIDLLLASAIKENLQFNSSIMVKSPEDLSHMVVPTPVMKRKRASMRKRGASYWAKMPFLPKYSI